MFLSLAATSSRVVSSAPTFWEWGVVLVSIVLGLIVLALAWRWSEGAWVAALSSWYCSSASHAAWPS